MAYLVFKNNVTKDLTTLLKAAKTDSDLEEVNQGHPEQVSTITITDEQYDSLFNGSKVLQINNETPSFVDPPEDSQQADSEEKLKTSIDEYKKRLTKCINRKPNHSQIGKVTAALDYVTNLDTSSFTYPTSTLDDKCIAEGKFVNFQCI
jgi:deoxyxylulose-5-phosphate synthase|tara:strand:+ start:756 stop:1202 length:447 start_codon:yes stop_codon:yes gene_type:complete